jgi:hypothetical protein
VKTARLALMLVLFATAGARAQLLEPASDATAKLGRQATERSFPSFPHFYAGSEGSPPADPLALDIYRLAPKLFAGVDLNPTTGIEMTLTNPDHYEGMRFQGFGPRRADSVQVGANGFNFDAVARVTVPVDNQLAVFGKVGVSAAERKKHDGSTLDVGPAASLGATYKLNSRQTATAEVPLGAIARKALTGSAGALGGHVKLGF